jgi:hypothetical protein
LEGVDDGGGGDIEDRPGVGGELEFHDTVDDEIVGHALKSGGGHGIAEDILRPAYRGGGRHNNVAGNEPKIAAFPG